MMPTTRGLALRPTLVVPADTTGAAGDAWRADVVGSPGTLFCKAVLGLRPDTYEAAFTRVVLPGGHAGARVRRGQAISLAESQPVGHVFLLVGQYVRRAFRVDGLDVPSIQPLVCQHGIHTAVLLPHPSVKNRSLELAKAAVACQRILRDVLPHIPFDETNQENP